jgi:hypothetical protein
MQRGTLLVSAIAGPGIIAGLAGGVIIDLYLVLTIVVLSHSATLLGFYQFVASGAIGPSAFADGTAGALIGVAVHLSVSVAWGIGYAYVAFQMPQVRSRPIVSGICFGLMVMVAMQLLEVAANIYHLPDATALINALIAHTLFFGLPVALIVSRTLKPA